MSEVGTWLTSAVRNARPPISASWPLALELLAQGQQIDRDALLVQAGVGLPYPAVAVDVEIVGLQELRDVVVDLGINQHRPHDGFLGFPIVRDAGR